MTPRPLSDIDRSTCLGLRAVLTDIDGTMTDAEGRVPARALAAMERARAASLAVVAVTGRPAGWCDMIARTWPVDGVVGENGGLAFWIDGGRMRRRYLVDEAARRAHRRRLDRIAAEVLDRVPGCIVAADQPYRELDLAIDVAEDTGPLDDDAIDAIVAVFESHGAHAKVSSIHVNGWYGDYDKLGMCLRMARQWWDLDPDAGRDRLLFVGDSPNDEPMFAHFEHTVGVANVRRFLHRLDHAPAYIADSDGADGFVEALDHVVATRGG